MLNPQFQQTFRGRVVKVEELRNFGGKNGKKEGKLFTIQIMDEESLIVATFFEMAAEKYHQIIQQGKVYQFKGVIVKPPRNGEQLKNLGCLQFDYSFDNSSQLIELDDVTSIPQNKFQFVKIETAQTLPANSVVDVIGIVKNTQELKEFQPKGREGKQFRRAISVVDDSQCEMEITLYGNLASQYPYNVNDVYMFKMLKVNIYQNNKSLTSSFASNVHVDPSDPRVKQLQSWFNNFDGRIKEPINKIKSIAQVNDESLKCENDPNYKVFSEVRAHLVMVRSSGTLYYQSCVNCLKKVQQNLDQYYCGGCQITMDQPRYRYILTCKLADQSGNLWATIGDQWASFIIDMPANELKVLIDEGKEKEKIEALNVKAFREFKFKLSSKLEEFNEIKRIKHQVSGISLVTQQDTSQILNQIDFYLQHA